MVIFIGVYKKRGKYNATHVSTKQHLVSSKSSSQQEEQIYESTHIFKTTLISAIIIIANNNQIKSNQINLGRLVANVLVEVNLSVEIFVEILLLFGPVHLLLPVLNEFFVARHARLWNHGELAFFDN